jgi:hypothetical protein
VSPERADTLSKRLWRVGVAILALATVLSLIGFKLFFMPLALTAWLCLMRASHWDGWITGYKAARKIYLHDSASDLERS